MVVVAIVMMTILLLQMMINFSLNVLYINCLLFGILYICMYLINVRVLFNVLHFMYFKYTLHYILTINL